MLVSSRTGSTELYCNESPSSMINLKELKRTRIYIYTNYVHRNKNQKWFNFVIPKSSAFQLQNFLRLVVNAAGEEGFNTESTMFVCNRWDMIPTKDRDAVAIDTFEKLSKFYTNLRKQQVHYMSLTEVLK